MAKKSPHDPFLVRVGMLTASQKQLIDDVISRLLRPVQLTQNDPRMPFGPDFARVFGEAIQLHHALSDRQLSKENFEYVLVKAMSLTGQSAKHGARGLAGHDIEVNGEKFSLKTQADQGIKRHLLHISKFMELGKGTWTDEASLAGLRDRFLTHLKGYSRIFTLRYFRTPPDRDRPATRHEYELVEIPKPLLLEAANGVIAMQHKSIQTPKPGYCRVYDATGAEKYALYFDGGTERKLQIKALDKSHCRIIATWVFDA